MAATVENINQCNGKYSDPYDDRYNSHWEAKPLRPYRSKDEYLYAMREDLTEWLNDLYDVSISPETFFENLDNGVLLCKHGNRVSQLAATFRQLNNDLNDAALDFSNLVDIKFRDKAQSGTFQARDNISNFIHWCRTCLRINSVLMFETDDLVMRKNDRSFILCLLEVARRGGLVGMPVPLLVQFEREIDKELNGETPSEPDSLASMDGSGNSSSATTTDVEPESPSEADSEGRSMDTSPEPPTRSTLSSSSSSSRSSRKSIPKRLQFTPRRRPKRNLNEESLQEEEPEEQVQVRLSEEVLKTLDELVRDLVNLCTCPNQFPMIREGEGKYRIGDSQTLIFVRILRSHVMVRVGGGWDTLEHYLDKHDPCRCQAHKGGSGVSRSRSMGRADGLYADQHPRRASYQGSSSLRRSFKSDSTSANDSDETESVRSLPSSKGTPEKHRPTTLQLPSHRSSPRNSLPRASPTDGSISSDSPTPSSETSSKVEDAFQRRRRLSLQNTKGTRSAPGSPTSGRRSRLAIPKPRAAPSSATEEFLRKRREAQIKAVAANNRIKSAPSSPTRGRSRTSELARYDNPPNELLKRVAGSSNGQPKLSRSPTRQTKAESSTSSGSGSRDRSLSPAVRGSTPRRKSSLGNKDNENVTLYIRRDSTGRHRLDSNSSCESVETQEKPKEATKQLPPKGYSPSQRLIRSQKTKRSFSSGRNGYHSRDNSLERDSTPPSSSSSSKGRNAVGRSRSFNQRDHLVVPRGAGSQKKAKASLQESFFRAPRKPRSRNNSFSSEPGDMRLPRSGRTSPTDSVKSNSSSKSLSRLRPVTPVPKNMKVEKVVPPIRKDKMAGPPSRIPMPVDHKNQIMEHQQEQAKAVLDDMLTWLKTRSYGDHGSDRFTLPQSPSGRESLSPTPSVRSDLHHDSGFEDNNHFRVTSPRDSVISPDTP